MEDRLAVLADRFEAAFPASIAHPRRVGREAEFPLVDADGRPGDVARLWAHLLDEGEPIHDLAHPAGELLVGVRTDRWVAVMEVGRSVVEVSVGPATSLHELAVDLDHALARVAEVAARLGWCLLGHGIQPAIAPEAAAMTPKRRYHALQAALGERWLPFRVTASDQLQVAVSRAELIPLANVLNAVSGVVIALSANSAVHGGRPGPYASGREGLSAFTGAERHRHGTVPRAFDDVVDFVRFVAGLTCLCLPDRDGGFPLVGRPFDQHLDRLDADDPAGWYEAFLFHDHYVWPSARPRARLGTLELRPACQQPPDEGWAAAALQLGLVEAWPQVRDLLADRFGDQAWPALAAYRARAVRSGPAAVAPAAGFLHAVVTAAEQGLRRRGFGEEALLAPVHARLEQGRDPAARARRVVVAGGIRALVRELDLRERG